MPELRLRASDLGSDFIVDSAACLHMAHCAEASGANARRSKRIKPAYKKYFFNLMQIYVTFFDVSE